MSEPDLFHEHEPVPQQQMLQYMSLQMREQAIELAAQRLTLGSIKESMAAWQVRMEGWAALSHDVEKLERRCQDLEMRNAQQDGAMGLVKFARDYGAWICAVVLVFLIGFFKH